MVLSLFVPLCISTGGNSGSQAATLITRALALGQLAARDWLRVLRHELLMGLVLGATLGVIGFVRASMTPEDVRGDTKLQEEAFEVRVPRGATLPAPSAQGTLELPEGSVQADSRQAAQAAESHAPGGCSGRGGAGERSPVPIVPLS